MEINRAPLGEILNSAASSIYFTERSAVYFNSISILFRLPAVAGISTFFLIPTSFSYQIQHPSSHLSCFDHFDHPIIRPYRHFFAIVGPVPADIWVLGIEQS